MHPLQAGPISYIIMTSRAQISVAISGYILYEHQRNIRFVRRVLFILIILFRIDLKWPEMRRQPFCKQNSQNKNCGIDLKW